MLALLQESANQQPSWLLDTRTVFVILQSAAIIAGVGAAYYRFVREEKHTSRLQPKVSGATQTHDGVIYLWAAVVVQNNGQVPVNLDRALTALELSTRKAGESGWTFRRIESVFRERSRLQPGEEVEDQVWLEISHENEVAIKLDLYVFENEDSMWPATEIVSLLLGEGGKSREDE